MIHKKTIEKLLLILTLTIMSNQLNGQAASGKYSKFNIMAEFKGHYGFLYSHHLELDRFQAHYPAFELSIEQATWGAKRWEAEYAYPIIGLSLWYSQLGGFEEIGSAIALYPFINFPIVYDKKQSLNFRLGLGLGYLTNYFHRTANFKNFAIGSHINVAGSISVEYRRKLSKSVTISGGVGLTHFSNGATKTPNYGLNIITANVGVSAFLRKPNPAFDKKILPRLYPFEFDGRKDLDIEFSFSYAGKDMTEQFGKRFNVYSVYINVLKRVSYKSRFGGGVDLVYDESDKYMMNFNGNEDVTKIQTVKPGISGVYELVVNRLRFMFNFGFYLYTLEKSEGTVYQRLTLKYYFIDQLFAHIVLNTNWGRAEYVGFGLGYKLNFVYKRKIKHL
ncbi:MAG: hypothetical protein DRI88_04400 [Bacteroidetes bacterium]|nr:MAG: hypothetical protein DRI72_08410 [Bacteroidota bacterium]RLD48070.1 MAG: hypothetical protein DRI88_04400 [Bacteroidota bacterium]RLD73978.1 MAG: hypothetical protein DRI87_02425 [Bacteroidota bacterium]